MTESLLALGLAELGDVATTVASLRSGGRESVGLSLAVMAQGLGVWVTLKLLAVAAAVLLVLVLGSLARGAGWPRRYRLLWSGLRVGLLVLAAWVLLAVGANLAVLGLL